MARVTNGKCVEAWLADKAAHSQSMRSVPPRLYSYDRIVAQRHPQGVLVVAPEHLSMTTTMHAYRAINAASVAELPWWRVPIVHKAHDPANIAYFLEHIARCMAQAERARSNLRWLVGARTNYIEELGTFCLAFGIDMPTLPPLSDKLIAKLALCKLRGESV